MLLFFMSCFIKSSHNKLSFYMQIFLLYIGMIWNWTNTKHLFQKVHVCIRYEVKANIFNSISNCPNLEKSQANCTQGNLVGNCTTGVSIKITQVVRRHLNEQRSVFKCLVYQIALEGIFIEAIHHTRHSHLAGAWHPANFPRQFQHLKAYIRNINYD